MTKSIFIIALSAMALTVALMAGFEAYTAQSPNSGVITVLQPPGPPITLTAPLLAKPPGVDVRAHCLDIADHNARAAAMRREIRRDGDKGAPDEGDDGDPSFAIGAIYENAEAMCFDPKRKADFAGVLQMSEFLDSRIAEIKETASLKTLNEEVLAVMLAALQLKPGRAEAYALLSEIQSKSHELADRFGDQGMYGVEAEAYGAAARLCQPGDATCPKEAWENQGIALEDFARWSANPDVYNEAVAAYRKSLAAMPADRPWDAETALHDRIGNAFAYLSEWYVDGRATAYLKKAMAEYEVGLPAADKRPMTFAWASIHTNYCAAIEPLGEKTGDRALIRRAEAECGLALGFWLDGHDTANIAIANSTLALAAEYFAKADNDLAEAKRAIALRRQTLELRGMVLQLAMYKRDLARVLIGAVKIARAQGDRSMEDGLAEAKTLQDDAARAFKASKSTGYLAGLELDQKELQKLAEGAGR